MTDNNDINNKYPHLTPIQVHSIEKSVEKMSHVRVLRSMKGDNKWTLLQELFQEVQANFIAKNPENMPSAKVIIEAVKVLINSRYIEDTEENKELKDLLLNSIPNSGAVTVWFRKEGWSQSVWDKIKNDELFSKERRAAMINALYIRGLQKDTVAAKLYLTMSGDYSDRPPDEKNKVTDTFREINSILHKKNNG